MHLIELLLPLYDPDGQSFGPKPFDLVRNELTKAFGGVTAFRRAPAEGVWKKTDGEVSSDEIVIFEVMAETLDRAWWSSYRVELEQRFRQEKIVVRASEFEEL